jgi:hypothetical protein
MKINSILYATPMPPPISKAEASRQDTLKYLFDHPLTSQSQYLDSFSGNKSRRHIFFGLMRVFHREFTILAAILVLRVLTTFSAYCSPR